MLEQCATYIEVWMGKIRKLKGVFLVMNQFDYDMAKNALVAECWIPDKYMMKCIDGMNRGVVRSLSIYFVMLMACCLCLSYIFFQKSNPFFVISLVWNKKQNSLIQSVVNFTFLFKW